MISILKDYDKKFIFLCVAIFSLAALHVYDITLLHGNIRKVRKEVWFTAQKTQNRKIQNIESCLEYLEDRIDNYPRKSFFYPNGFNIEKEYENLVESLDKNYETSWQKNVIDMMIEKIL